MPQPSYEYALGRISVLSTHLLTAAQLRRIAEADSTKTAMKLLLETGLSVAAVAGACGFGDEKYFMRAFKRHVGVTPSQFRRAHCRLHTNIK